MDVRIEAPVLRGSLVCRVAIVRAREGVVWEASWLSRDVAVRRERESIEI